jgi:16S rRNA processing protein RimM
MRRAGIVGRAHGLDGSFYVAEPQPALLAVGTELTVGGVTTTVVRRAGTDLRPIVRLAICEERAEADALRGQELEAGELERSELGPDEYLAAELEGARVVDGARELGVVRELIGLPSCECLAVVRPSGGELLVPLVRDAIRSIDVAGRLIEVNAEFLGEGVGGE